MKPAVNRKQHQCVIGRNPSRFRQLIQSYWRSVVNATPKTLTDNHESYTSDLVTENKHDLNSVLTNDIVGFVCGSELSDVETLRRAIICQVVHNS